MSTITRYTKKFVHYLRTNRAVSALEYAILVGVISVGLLAAIGTFEDQITAALTAIGAKVKVINP